MSKVILSWLVVLPLLFEFGAIASAQIVVEDASATWEDVLIADEFPDMPPRITLEYTSVVNRIELAPPDSAPDIPPRVVIEYASAIARFGLAGIPTCGAPFVPGDCNEDCSVTSADVTCTIIEIFNPAGNASADCNGDGSVTSADVTCTILCTFGMCP